MSDRRGSRSRDGLFEWVSYLQEIGVRELRVVGTRSPVPGPRRHASPDPAPTDSDESVSSLLPGFSLADRSSDAGVDPAAALAEIREEIGDCSRCRLCEGRTNIVFGTGNPRARLMFIGEGPGVDEDAQGEPFVGRAGKKLNEMIRAIGLQREEVYIANVVKCRPPDNRDPKPDEVAVCSPFLFRQIEAIRPKVLVTLGSPATKLVLNSTQGITRLRGTWHEFRGIPVMPTFHPAYLLRSYTVENRRRVFEDLKAARARMDEPS